mmetsp:Transcript_7416/g.14434  ORF Transcript_7416/g.14434 Transcript_7416/m.14434 type:complete len:245 (+) Transcript_7416:544-1278(+)
MLLSRIFAERRPLLERVLAFLLLLRFSTLVVERVSYFLPAQHNVQQHAKGPVIRREVRSRSRGDLRGPVPGGPGDVLEYLRVFRKANDQAEVGDLAMPRPREQDVRRLQVAIAVLEAVDVVDAEEDLGGVENGAIGVEAPGLLEVLAQVPAHAQLEHHVHGLGAVEGVLEVEHEGRFRAREKPHLVHARRARESPADDALRNLLHREDGARVSLLDRYDSAKGALSKGSHVAEVSRVHLALGIL